VKREYTITNTCHKKKLKKNIPREKKCKRILTTSRGNAIFGKMSRQAITGCSFKAVNNCTDIPTRFEYRG
jgi:hypothetical protein